MQYPVTGATQTSTEALLNASPRQDVIANKPVVVLENTDRSITEFCRDGRVYSVRLQAPFVGDVRGVRIGDTKAHVLKTLGKPHRTWPIKDDRDRWFYDEIEFLRVDFERDGDRVEFILV